MFKNISPKSPTFTSSDLNEYYAQGKAYAGMPYRKAKFLEDVTKVGRLFDWKELDREETFSIVYDTPIYTHTPLTVMLVSPLVKGLNYLADSEVIPHIEEEPGYTGTTKAEIASLKTETMTRILRLIPMGLFAVALWLIFRMMRYKIGNNAYLFTLPVAVSVMMLIGNYLFYWDAFMMFFFVLTLYLMEMKPNSKWKYVTACALVNTKIFLGVLFLLPLVIKAVVSDRRNGWVMILPALSLLPFYLATIAVTGDPFYILTHYLNQTATHNFVYTLWAWPEGLMLITMLGTPFFLVMTAPILRYFKKYPEYATYWIVTMMYAWGTGLGITHASSMVYAGALTFPLVANEWGLVGKLRGWLKVKSSTEVIEA